MADLETLEGPYDILYADPPWHYNGTQIRGCNSGNATNHYNTLHFEQLKSLSEDIQRISNANSLLFLWTTGPKLDEALQLGSAWGFEYRQVAFVWHKQRTVYGHYTLTSCEYVLLFKRKGGKIPKPRGSRKEKQFLEEPVREHSRKPDEIRKRITCMFPEQRKVELFGRCCVQGWDTWGDQVDLFSEVEEVD